MLNSEAQTPFSECIPIAPCVGASVHFDNTTDGILHNPMCFLRTVAIAAFSLCVVKIVKVMTTSGVRTLFQFPVLRIRNYRISSGSLDPLFGITDPDLGGHLITDPDPTWIFL